MEFLKELRVARCGVLIAATALTLVTVSAQVPTSLAIPGRANANASIAADGDVVVVAWGASLLSASGAADIYAAVSRDRGRTFGPPVRVNDTDGEAKISGEQPPRVAIRKAAGSGAAAPIIVVSWVSKRDGTTIRVAQSIDGGRRFAASRAVSTPGTPGNRGWQAMTLDANGDVEIVWLDHRDMASQPAHQMDAATHGTHDGAAMAARSGLYAARVTAGGVQPERRVTTGVCYCCKTAVAAARDGSLIAAWRHVYPGNIRDIAFARAVDGRTFSGPVRVSADQWQLDGCPDDGPAIAVDAAGATHIVWPTLVKPATPDGEPRLALFYASSRDGVSFTPRSALPTEGAAHHPQIAAARDGSLALAWDEVEGGVRHAVVARATMVEGRIRVSRDRIAGDGPDAYPVLAAAGDVVVVAWSSGTGEGSRIKVAPTPTSRPGATNSR